MQNNLIQKESEYFDYQSSMESFYDVNEIKTKKKINKMKGSPTYIRKKSSYIYSAQSTQVDHDQIKDENNFENCQIKDFDPFSPLNNASQKKNFEFKNEFFQSSYSNKSVHQIPLQYQPQVINSINNKYLLKTPGSNPSQNIFKITVGNIISPPKFSSYPIKLNEYNCLNNQQISFDHQNEQQPVYTNQTQNQLEKIKCKCRKSHCLKKYCVCFINNIFCDNCDCIDCENTELNQSKVIHKVQNLLRKDANAFKPKVEKIQESNGNVLIKHFKGCNCKTGCNKKYCECHRNGAKCSSLCNCVDCNNMDIDVKKQQLENQRLKLEFEIGSLGNNQINDRLKQNIRIEQLQFEC